MSHLQNGGTIFCPQIILWCRNRILIDRAACRFNILSCRCVDCIRRLAFHHVWPPKHIVDDIEKPRGLNGWWDWRLHGERFTIDWRFNSSFPPMIALPCSRRHSLVSRLSQLVAAIRPHRVIFRGLSCRRPCFSPGCQLRHEFKGGQLGYIIVRCKA